METHVFLMMLLVVATLTGLVTEAIKMLLDEWKIGYHANTLAGAVAIVLSIGVVAVYVIMIDALFDTKMASFLIALMFLSWLSAMVGYDKVIQAIGQFAGK